MSSLPSEMGGKIQNDAAQLQIPEEWQQVAADLKSGMVLILGDVDTGKSTLASYLVRQWRKRSPAVVDADLGQSMLGPPAVVGLGDCQPSGELRLLSMRFIGATSPVGHLSATVSAVKNLADKAVAAGATITLVNTCGLIRGKEGEWLKQQKIRLLRPQYLLALQRQEELEHLLTPYHRGDVVIRRLPVPPTVGRKTEAQRRTFRERRFQQYFSQAKPHQFSVRIIRGLIDPDLPDSNDRWRELLVGLNNAGSDTLALGIVEQVSTRTGMVSILSPPISPAEISEIQLGSIRVIPSGEQLSYWER